MVAFPPGPAHLQEGVSPLSLRPLSSLTTPPPPSLTPASYLESIDTILQALPPIFDLHDPTPAHTFLSQDPHPSVQHLQSVSLYCDNHIAVAHGPGAPPQTHLLPALAGPSSPAAAQWSCTLAALARLPALREVRLAIRSHPVEECDLRPLARRAGAALAARFDVDLPRDEDRDGPCQICGTPPGRFIVPAGNTGGAAGDDGGFPPFGRVRWHEPLRYVIDRDGMPLRERVVRGLNRRLCYDCNRRYWPVLPDGEEPAVGP